MENKTTMELQNEIKQLKQEVQKFELQKQKKRERQRRYYKNKFKLDDDMSDEEKQQIRQNRKRINELAQKRYNANPYKNRERNKNNYFKKLSPEKQKLYLERKQKRDRIKAMEEKKKVYIRKRKSSCSSNNIVS